MLHDVVLPGPLAKSAVAPHDFVVGIKRALRIGGRDYALTHAFEVSSTVIGVDDERVHVALDADFRVGRSSAVKQSVGTLIFGGVLSAALSATLLPVFVVAAPARVWT